MKPATAEPDGNAQGVNPINETFLRAAEIEAETPITIGATAQWWNAPGVEVVGRGEGATFREIHGVLTRMMDDPEIWKARRVELEAAADQWLSIKMRPDMRSNIALTNSPLTAPDLKTIAEKLEV